MIDMQNRPACRQTGRSYRANICYGILSCYKQVAPTGAHAYPRKNGELINFLRCLDGIVGDPKIEIIISDGGSTDRTVEIAERYKDVKVVSSPMGRGVQMNAGASYAHGEILLFLHADCILPTNVLLNVRHIFENNHVVGGAFKIKLLSNKFPYRLIEVGISLRSQVFKLPYGDQGLFVNKIFKC